MFARTAMLLVMALSARASAGLIEETVLYDIDFEPPYYLNNDAVQADLGPLPRPSFTSVNIGSAKVDSDVPGAAGNAAVLMPETLPQATSTTAELECALAGVGQNTADGNFQVYRLEFDVAVFELGTAPPPENPDDPPLAGFRAGRAVSPRRRLPPCRAHPRH